MSLICIYENIRQKIFSPLEQYMCKHCKSKKLIIIGDECDKNRIVSKLYLQCEECDGITEVIFENIDDIDSKYIKGVIE